MKPTVLIVDESTLVREGIGALLEHRLGLTVVGAAADGQAAIEMAARATPDLVLIEPALKRLNGVEVTRRIRIARPATRVMALAAEANRQHVGHMLHAGACGYVLKSAPLAELKQALDAVLTGGSYLCPAVADIVVDQYVRGDTEEASPRLAALTPREREVLQLRAEGHPGREIAGLLGVSIKTVDTHRYQVMKKLKLRGLADLTRYALREGLVTLQP
ncbi:MAG: response regulator transcription factor [Phycisphaeraceae bacterium]